MKHVHSEALSKESMMLEYFSLVRMLAKKLSARLPASVEVDDLVSAGLIGLMQALERFNPQKGYKFKTYAEFRIRGAMLDELRSQDWAPKGMRQKAKQFEKICENLRAKNGRRATDAELCEALHLSKTRYEQLVRDVNTLEQMNLASYKQPQREDENTSPAIELVPDTGLSADPFAKAEQLDVRACLEKAMARLEKNEREVLVFYYFNDLNLKEIGERLEISESRVCQLHMKAIAGLKRALNSGAAGESDNGSSLAA